MAISKTITQFINNISGATAIEYGLISSLIAVSSITAVTATSESVQQTFCDVSYAMTTQFIPGCRVTLDADVTVAGPFADSGIFLEAGQTVEITPVGDWTVSQYRNTTDRQDDPFNSMNHIDPTEVITKDSYNAKDSKGKNYRMSAFGARIMDESGQDYDTSYKHDSGLNMAIAQNGKVTITAQSDGYLYMGIHDDYAADNTFVGDPPSVSVALIGQE